MEHKYTETTEINFSKLKERLMAINAPNLGQFNSIREMLYNLSVESEPTLIMATGGSKVVAYYLKLILERMGSGLITEVIEPRDYFYKANRESYANLIIISASGKTNGIKEALADFNGKKYLLCEKTREENCEVVAWGNELYQKEKSFISLATSLAPITLLLDATMTLNLEITAKEIEKINNKINELIAKSINRVAKMQIDFKDVPLVQIISGYDTQVSSYVLESNLVEAGLVAPIIHDKGSFCHGRSNLLLNYPDSYFLYLTHEEKELDKLLIDILKTENINFSLFSTTDLQENIFWKDYYLLLQMYFLSKKIAEDKKIDLTMPEYNPRIVKKLYTFKGEM